MQNKGFLEFAGFCRHCEMRTYGRQSAGLGAKSPEIVPKRVLEAFTVAP
jgi:hypothetical protein